MESVPKADAVWTKQEKKTRFPSRPFSVRTRQAVQYIFDLLLGVTALGAATFAPLPHRILFRDSFNYPDGLITNEYAYHNPKDPLAVRSSNWDVTSGALFALDGTAWTGGLSEGSSTSAVFRLVSRKGDFENVAVSFDLMNQGLNSTSATPPRDWDGVHVFLRYQNQYSLYYVSVNRRDNTVIIKKKVPGGPSNGGTYYDLSSHAEYPVPYQAWQNVKVTVKNNADGSVTMQLFIDGAPLLGATDTGVGGVPLRRPGRVGIRGDNADIKFSNFIVMALPEE